MTDRTTTQAVQAILDCYAQSNPDGAAQLFDSFDPGLRSIIRGVCLEHMHATDDATLFEYLVGSPNMATWLQEYAKLTDHANIIEDCPNILNYWWDNYACTNWARLTHDPIGTILLMYACHILVKDQWHLWYTPADTLLSKMGTFYIRSPHLLSLPQQYVIRQHVTLDAWSDPQLSSWLKSLSSYTIDWEEEMLMTMLYEKQIPNSSHITILNQHSRTIAYYIRQYTEGQQEPCVDGMPYAPLAWDDDALFGLALIHFASELEFNVYGTPPALNAYQHFIDSITPYYAIDPSFRILLDWLRRNNVKEWIRDHDQESWIAEW